MSLADLLHLSQAATWLMVIVSSPPLIAAAAVGLTVGVFQTLTQIQDASLAFVFKIFAVVAVLAATSAWFGVQMLEFATQMLTEFPTRTR